jgi:pilus assembly protein CpaE
MKLITVIPDELLDRELAAGLVHVPELRTIRALTSFPDLDGLLRTVRVHKPDALIVYVDDLPKVEPLLSNLDDLMPGLPVIGIGRRSDVEVTKTLMHWGIRESILPPITHEKLVAVADFLERHLKKHPAPAAQLGDLYSFFPAKPGVGTSTVALSTSCALAEEFSLRTLLMDCDLAAGTVKFNLKLGTSASIVDALGHAQNLDEDLWRQMVGKWDKLDVLHAGSLNPPANIDSDSIQHVLSLARAEYEVICADLGSSLDAFSIEILRESRRILLVTTPELLPVYVARARFQSFKDLGLEDRVSLVLNRKDKWRGHLEAPVVAEAVGAPVAYVIGNDYTTCSDAILKGNPVSGRSDIAQGILNLAHSLTVHRSGPAAPPVHGHHKYLEFFHIPASSDPTTIWRG